VNLKKIFVIEIVVVVVVALLSVLLVEVTPYLAYSKTDQIGVFNQREYAQENVTIRKGQRASSQFNYTTYDPAILVVDLAFQSWQTPGTLSLYCNGILIVSFEATPRNPTVQLTTVTFSGYDLVQPPPPKLGPSLVFAYGNEITVYSPQEGGFEGSFSYRIGIRGSR
jgi:hypothetical protein